MQSPLNPKIMYVFWDLSPPQLPPYQQITPILHPKPQPHHTIHQKTSCPCPIYKLQKCTKNNLPSNSCNNTVLLRYVFVMGVYLHFQKRQSFPQGWDVFNSHVNLKIQLTHFHLQSYPSYPIFHSPIKLCVIFTQFTKTTQNDFDTDFEKTLIFPSKIKFSDNLKI